MDNTRYGIVNRAGFAKYRNGWLARNERVREFCLKIVA